MYLLKTTSEADAAHGQTTQCFTKGDRETQSFTILEAVQYGKETSAR